MNQASVTLFAMSNQSIDAVTALMRAAYVVYEKSDLIHYTVCEELETVVVLRTYEVSAQWLTDHLKGNKVQMSSGKSPQFILRIKDCDAELRKTAQAVADWAIPRRVFEEAVQIAGGKTQKGKALEALVAKHFGAEPCEDDRWYIGADYRLPDGRLIQHKSKLATLCSASSVLTAMGMQG